MDVDKLEAPQSSTDVAIEETTEATDESAESSEDLLDEVVPWLSDQEEMRVGRSWERAGSRAGQGVIEYALVASLISVAGIAALTLMTSSVYSLYHGILVAL